MKTSPKNRRFYFLFAVLLMLTVATAARSETAKVIISGTTEEVRAYEQKEITYISFSGLVDIAGGILDWEIVGQQISYVNDTNRFLFAIGSPYFKRNDSLFNMTYAAEFDEGELFLPAETFVSFWDQVTHQKISWAKSSKTVRIDSEYFNVTDMSVAAKANGLLVEIFLTGAMA